ncbi:cytochrome b5 isoform X2 [Nomia melanderi]|uniref:cytochrome b5 isoform X2 n=1 Tax=Nomia melanderi TaxID=2448451 RepID=UPI00130403B3|nr:cytochrome b5-like isoform X2 [Nomia melanderi]
MATESTKSDTAPIKLYSREEVAKHTDTSDLWVIINRKVYNLSAFLSEHPGGEEIIIEQAGQDATEPFEDIGHSSDARQMMEPYKIGELEDADVTEENVMLHEDNSSCSGSWRSWLIPIALGALATLVYRYFIKAH